MAAVPATSSPAVLQYGSIIIAVGNPGVGKSTILNSIAGDVLFKSGVNIGSGLTDRLIRVSNQRGIFYDTPGLADDTLREAAAKAISEALKEGGNFRILFFIKTDAGRVVKQDITTIKLVLDAAPEIKNRYGIIINMVSESLANLLEDESNLTNFLSKLFFGIDEEKRCAPSSIYYILKQQKLEDKNDVLADLDEIITLKKIPLKDFVYGKVPRVALTPGAVGEIKHEEFDVVLQRLENIENQLESKLAQDKSLQQQYKRDMEKFILDAEKKKEEEKKEDQKRWREFMKQYKMEKQEKEFLRSKRHSSPIRRYDYDDEDAPSERHAVPHGGPQFENYREPPMPYDDEYRPHRHSRSFTEQYPRGMYGHSGDPGYHKPPMVQRDPRSLVYEHEMAENAHRNSRNNKPCIIQ